MYLSVPLPEHPPHSMGVAGDKGGISLEDCIRMYCEEETLEGGEETRGVKIFSNRRVSMVLVGFSYKVY